MSSQQDHSGVQEQQRRKSQINSKDVEQLNFDRITPPSQSQSATPNLGFLGKQQQDEQVMEMNEEYANALMSSMLTRMKSTMAQKMMGVVEQERALMLEQQSFNDDQSFNAPSRKSIIQQNLAGIQRDDSLTSEENEEGTPTIGQLKRNISIPQQQPTLEEQKSIVQNHLTDISSYMKKRIELLQKSESEHFSRDIKLDRNEINAEKKLIQLREKMLTEDPSLVTGMYYDKFQKLKASPLYEALIQMPKPAVHHLHITAAAPVDYLVELTYRDYVYYNDRAQLFKVSKIGIFEEGYQKTSVLRKHWGKAEEFDAYLREKILLSRKDGCCQESHPIWAAFQPKFMLTCDLINYFEFFERCLVKVCKIFIKQNVFVLELRHIFCMIIDDKGKQIGVEKEIEIFRRVQEKIQRDYPLFQMKLIICGLKVLGQGHCQKAIDDMKEGMKSDSGSQLIVGYDLVNEEDYVIPIKELLPMIFEASKDGPFPLIFHAGESVDVNNENLYDAILLGTKRIGHGFNLALHPHLQQLVKEKQICIECCPVSNMILGYVLDLRCHPVRAFLHQGIPVSISPDDPGFFDYDGVVLDYVYAFLAWELDLADLKKLCLNSLEFASISAEEKAALRPLFNEKWQRFCEYVKSKY